MLFVDIERHTIGYGIHRRLSSTKKREKRWSWQGGKLNILGKIIVFGILSVFVVVLCLGVFAYFSLKVSEPPGADAAQYGIQAYYQDNSGHKIPTRIYYAHAVEIQDGNAVLSTYWTYDGVRYHKHRGERIIPPPYDIVRRGE